MAKLFLCGISFSKEIYKIKELVNKTKEYVDGFCWVIDPNEGEEIFNFLDNNKKSGKIIYHPWQNAFDWQRNEILYSNIFEEKDWIWMFDSSELPTEYWLNNIRDQIKYMEINNKSAFYFSGRPYIFKYSDYLYFYGNPHTGLAGLSNNIDIGKEEEKHKFIINKRDLNPDKHYQEHDTKYYLWARSNQLQMFYGKYNQEIVNFHEHHRIIFREYLKENFGEASLKTLDILFSQDILKWKNLDFITNMIELEFCLSEYFQRTILKMDFMTTMHPRYRWSFKNYIQYGDGWYDKNYLGTILRYNKQFNI